MRHDVRVELIDARQRLGDSLGVLRPASFYASEGAEQIRAFLQDAKRTMNGAPGEMVGALLSLGDIAFELKSKAA